MKRWNSDVLKIPVLRAILRGTVSHVYQLLYRWLWAIDLNSFCLGFLSWEVGMLNSTHPPKTVTRIKWHMNKAQNCPWRIVTTQPISAANVIILAAYTQRNSHRWTEINTKFWLKVSGKRKKNVGKQGRKNAATIRVKKRWKFGLAVS